MFGYREIIYWFLVALSFVESETSALRKKKDFCLKISRLPSCDCSNKTKQVVCKNVNDSESNVIFEINFDDGMKIVHCLHAGIPSLEAFPDLTEYINTTQVFLDSCPVTMNGSLYDYTSKISKNMKHLSLNLAGINNEDKDFNTNYFTRITDLISLNLRVHRRIDFRLPLENIFEKLVELENLKIRDLPTPNGIFDSLKQLKSLSIFNHFLKPKALQYGIFKNQRKLTILRLDGFSVDYFHPQLFASMTELETFILINSRLESLPEYMLKHNHKLETFQMTDSIMNISNLLQLNNHEHLPEDLFKNLTNISKITITGNQLSSLPKNSFKDQIHLDFLDLERNHLVNLTDGLFDSLTSLRVLILSFNKLSSLSK